MTRFVQLNRMDSAWYGVVDTERGGAWVVEPEFTWAAAVRMAEKLNVNPDIEAEKLYEVTA